MPRPISLVPAKKSLLPDREHSGRFPINQAAMSEARRGPYRVSRPALLANPINLCIAINACKLFNALTTLG